MSLEYALEDLHCTKILFYTFVCQTVSYFRLFRTVNPAIKQPRSDKPQGSCAHLFFQLGFKIAREKERLPCVRSGILKRDGPFSFLGPKRTVAV